MTSLISERRFKNDALRTDILSLLMSARDENGQQMTDEELRDHSPIPQVTYSLLQIRF